MKLVYRLRHMSLIRLENNYLYHLLGRGMLQVHLLPVLFHSRLRFRDKGTRLFLMLGLSSCIDEERTNMHRYLSLKAPLIPLTPLLAAAWKALCATGCRSPISIRGVNLGGRYVGRRHPRFSPVGGGSRNRCLTLRSRDLGKLRWSVRLVNLGTGVATIRSGRLVGHRWDAFIGRFPSSHGRIREDGRSGRDSRIIERFSG